MYVGLMDSGNCTETIHSSKKARSSGCEETWWVLLRCGKTFEKLSKCDFKTLDLKTHRIFLMVGLEQCRDWLFSLPFSQAHCHLLGGPFEKLSWLPDFLKRITLPVADGSDYLDILLVHGKALLVFQLPFADLFIFFGKATLWSSGLVGLHWVGMPSTSIRPLSAGGCGFMGCRWRAKAIALIFKYFQERFGISQEWHVCVIFMRWLNIVFLFFFGLWYFCETFSRDLSQGLWRRVDKWKPKGRRIWSARVIGLTWQVLTMFFVGRAYAMLQDLSTLTL